MSCKRKTCQFNRPLNRQRSSRTCHYCHDTGKARGCSTEDCKYYLDPIIERKRSEIAYGSALEEQY